MPPKIRITKNNIIKTALELCRKSGVGAVNARNIATVLNCSTQPVFSNFATMEELQQAVVNAAYKLYLGFLQAETESEKYPKYKAFGMAYIRFAKEEKELFRLLFMCDRNNKVLPPTIDFEASVEMIMNANKVTKEKARLMHMEIWAFAHGIATMLVTSFFMPDTELISDMMTDIYQGVRLRHLSEGNSNVCN